VKKINGKPVSFYRDSIFQFLSMDGYGINHKYQSLSNRGNFGGWYRNVFGLEDRFRIGYLNPVGEEKTVIVPVFDPRRDTLSRRFANPFDQLSRRERRANQLFNNRNVQVDTAGSTAYLTLNTFIGGNGLHRFFRKTFKNLKKYNIQHLVIDVRSNGGGNVGNSTVLTEYIINRRFKLADSLYAINKTSRYKKYINNYLQNLVFLTFISKKRKDGKYHFGYFERHYFKPKRKYHYNGKVYVLIGGNSFSATTLFANCIRQQPNVTLIGEETGGSAYGNTAWLIPDVSLPNTKVRFRLPRFRMVVNKDYPKDGRGVLPDIEVKPTAHAIRQGIDLKVEKVKELIRAADQKRVSRD
jgi:C-terminal processing protease CtpA/Prc